MYNWSGAIKHINFNKHVKSLVMTGDKLYCGCSGYSIQVHIFLFLQCTFLNRLRAYNLTVQDVDLGNLTSTTFYAGTKKLLGKQTIHSLHMHNGLLFAGGSSVDGTAGKVGRQLFSLKLFMSLSVN